MKPEKRMQEIAEKYRLKIYYLGMVKGCIQPPEIIVVGDQMQVYAVAPRKNPEEVLNQLTQYAAVMEKGVEPLHYGYLEISQ